MIISPRLKTENAFLREIMKEFGVGTKQSFADSLDLFRAFLAAEYKAGRTVVLLIDEAQGIRSVNFELIRSLLNYETDSQKLLNVVLFGQNELATKLDNRPELKSRVTIFGALTSLSREDTESMIRFRYRVSGGEDPPFAPAAYDALFRYSTGLPRMICTLSDTALTKAFVREQRTIDDALVRAAAEEMRAVVQAERTARARKAA